MAAGMADGLPVRLLAFETATEACSVALYIDGDVHARHEVAPRRHAELALPWAEALLSEAGISRRMLDAIACGQGPGAFTGVRLAIALTQGIALGLDLPVVGISTLAALAQQTGSSQLTGQAPHPNAQRADRAGPAHDPDRIVAAIDARMGEVYLGAFIRDADGLVRADGDELLAPPDTIALPRGPWTGVGTGFAAQDGVLSRRAQDEGLLRDGPAALDPSALPHAAAVARLAARAFAAGNAIAPEHLQPTYLRNKVALTLQEQESARR